MPTITHKELISWGESHGKKPAAIARDLKISTQTLNGWRKRGQVAARETDRVAAYMAETDSKAGRNGLKSQIVTVYGKVTRDLRPAHERLLGAVSKLAGTLTDEQATQLTDMIHRFAGQNFEHQMDPVAAKTEEGGS